MQSYTSLITYFVNYIYVAFCERTCYRVQNVRSITTILHLYNVCNSNSLSMVYLTVICFFRQLEPTGSFHNYLLLKNEFLHCVTTNRVYLQYIHICVLFNVKILSKMCVIIYVKYISVCLHKTYNYQSCNMCLCLLSIHSCFILFVFRKLHSCLVCNQLQ